MIYRGHKSGKKEKRKIKASERRSGWAVRGGRSEKEEEGEREKWRSCRGGEIIKSNNHLENQPCWLQVIISIKLHEMQTKHYSQHDALAELRSSPPLGAWVG